MSTEFEIEILTPGQNLLKEKVSEVIVPAWDGESGILANHENFVGKLGTGALKIVKGGNDFWYMVSGGVYEVRDGAVSVLAEIAEAAGDVDTEASKQIEAELSGELPKLDLNSTKGRNTLSELDRAKARLEVDRRTRSVH